MSSMFAKAGFPVNESKSGTVVWITGLAGSGKTRLSSLLEARLISDGLAVARVDGDSFRKTQVPHLGYSRGERRQCAMALAQHCAMLAAAHDVTIAATISLLHEVHELNRQLHERYIEVVLDVDAATLRKRRPLPDDMAHVWVGQGIPAEWPLEPHLRLGNNVEADLGPNVDTIRSRLLHCIQ